MTDESQIDHPVLLNRAMRSLRAGGGTVSDAALKRLATFSPGFAPGYLAWGDRLSRAAGGGNGLSLLRRALVLGPADPRIYQSLADLEYRRRDAGKARLYARARLMLAPGEGGAFRTLASAAFHRGNHEAVVRNLALARCIAAPNPVDLLILMWALFELDRLVECCRAARWFLLASPFNPDGYTLLARTLARLNDLSCAAIQVRRLEKLKPGDPDVLLAKGRVAQAQRHHLRAVRDFREAMLVEPSRGEAMLDLSRALWAAETFEDAERMLGRACVINPSTAIRAEVLRFTATERDFRLPGSKK